MANDDAADHPPELPAIERPLRFYPVQWLGMPLLVAIPILALFGLVGDSWTTLRNETPQVAISVRYPARFRYGEVAEMHVFVRNISARAIDTVSVSVDSTYINRFSGVTFLPSARQPYEVDLVGIPPGEDRLVVVEMQGERYWRHQGELRVVSGAGKTAFRLSTIIFP